MGSIMKRVARMIVLLCLFVNMCVLVGCTTNAVTDPSPSPGVSTSPTDPPITPTVTQSLTLTPTQTSTPKTPSPTLRIPTPRALTLEEARRLSLFPSAIDGCALPCWNHLEPGKSGLDDISDFFSNMGVAIELPISEPDVKSDLYGTYGYFMSGEDTISLSYVEVSWIDKVESIHLWYLGNVNLDSKDAFLHPYNLISTIGVPETVSMYVEQNNYSIFMGFPESNVGILFEGYLSDFLTSPRICFSKNEDVSVRIRLYADTFDYIPPIGMVYNYENLTSPEIFTPYNESMFLSKISDGTGCVPIQYAN